ncbi:MAG: hypothetical protein KGH95_08110, partial [Thaumarchaeota archaeon]|nr:hypothetical protein [Nitrososphaerota archaeon]
GKFSSGLITDYEYFLRCCIIYGYKLYLIPIITIGYRKHEEQLSLKHDLIEKESKITRDNMLDRLPISLRKKYLVAVSRYQRNIKPYHIVMRRKIRDAVFKTIPDTKRNEIINWYLKRRGIRKYHDIYIKDKNDHKEPENERGYTSTEE